MSEDALKRIDRYGLPLVALLVISWVAWQFFEEIKASNAEVKDLVVNYHMAVTTLGSTVEDILGGQTVRDQNADLTREEANEDRERNRELINLILKKIDRFEVIYLRAREIDQLRHKYLALYLNADAVRQGLDAPFPAQEFDELEGRLKLLLEEEWKVQQ